MGLDISHCWVRSVMGFDISYQWDTYNYGHVQLRVMAYLTDRMCTIMVFVSVQSPTVTGLDISNCVSSCPRGPPSRGGDVVVHAFDENQPSLPTPFYSVLVSISVFTAFSTVFHSMNSPDNSPLSHSVLPAIFLPYWSFSFISLQESLPQP